MKPGRNDPCPCGSGRKYKHCCAERDTRSAPALRLLGADTLSSVLAATSAVIDRPIPWEADVTPASVGLADDVAARPTAVLIAAGGDIIHVDFVSHPPSDADGVARLLADAMRDTITRGAMAPSKVKVRHRAVAASLRRMLADVGIKVETAQALPTLAEFASQLRQGLTGADIPMPAISMPDTWAAWALPHEMIAKLFEASARFHAAEPWLLLDNEQIVDLLMPSSRRWSASVLGNGGQQFGLVLYELRDDVLAMFGAPSPEEAFDAMRGAVLTLNLDRRSDLPKPMQREIARAGWKVNGANAYPSLWTLNTIGGGLSPEHAQDLLLALNTIARFTRKHAKQLGNVARRGAPVAWEDGDSGVLVIYEGLLDVGSLWPPVVSLSTALPEGEHADPKALYREDGEGAVTDAMIVQRFLAAERAAGAAESRVERDGRNVELFMDAMHGYQGVTIAAITEFDLRSFLYDWFPRKVRMSRTDADTMRASLRRFTEFLAEHEAIRYPWARAILRDKLAFEERWDTFPGGFWWDARVADWCGEVGADLADRVMLPADSLVGVGEWGATMGLEEARLRTMLQRQWLLWRDEVINKGERMPAKVRAALVRQQGEWERRPQPWLNGKSVSEIVRLERERQPR